MGGKIYYNKKAGRTPIVYAKVRKALEAALSDFTLS